MAKIPVLCIVGPTASGKTALSVAVAQAVGGEIITMDSMQIYRQMDIGTAKPSIAERQGIPHYLLDVVAPDETYSVAQYAKDAEAAIAMVYAKGKLPIVAGGTGFYLRALTDGLSLGGVPSDPAIRERLKALAQTPGGHLMLHSQLQAIDPDTAQRLHPNDVQRVSRAIEVYELTGKPFSQQERELPERPFDFCMLGTTMERSLLYQRANERVDSMLQAGLLSEVKTLLDGGLSPLVQSMQGIGYKELVPVLTQSLPLAAAVESLKQNTRRYAKRQWTWFRAEQRIQWLDMTLPQSIEDALRIAKAFWKDAQQ